MIGQLILQEGEIASITLEWKTKLQAIWRIENLKVIPLGREVFHVLLHSINDQSLLIAYSMSYTRLGLLRISRWHPGFNPKNHIQTMLQVWVRFYYLPLEY